MKDKQEVRKKLDALQKGIVQHLPAKVVAVQAETCTVEYEGIEVYDVLLRASENGKESKCLIKPTIGSYVMIGRILHSKRFYVAMFSEIEEVEIIANKSIAIKNKLFSLQDLITELIGVLKAAVITTPQGPGSMDPSTITQLKGVEDKFKQLLK